MIRLFKSVDDKLADIGFTKIREDEYGCEYERKESYCTHKVCMLRKKSGRHILQSYDPEALVDSYQGNLCVGLTAYEMKLFLKKMKKIGLYSINEVTNMNM